MNNYIVYNATTEAFVKNITVYPDDGPNPNATRDANIDVGDTFISGTLDYPTEYIVAGVVTPRPANTSIISATNVTSGTVVNVTNIPNPSTGKVNDVLQTIGSAVIIDGLMSFSSLDVGVYTISISSFPYQDIEFTVVVS